MSYVLTGKIGEHQYTRDLGRGYSEEQLAAAKQSIRYYHEKNWGKQKGQKFKFNVAFK